jgi:AcrR family transcriptional regulator
MAMSIPYERTGRIQQKARTRAALVESTRELLEQGMNPTVEQAAQRASVSRTTAYRYFPSQGHLLARVMHVAPAILDTYQTLLGSIEDDDDTPERLEALVRGFLRNLSDSQDDWRRLITFTVQHGGEPTLSGEPGINAVRGEDRRKLIRAALAPVESKLDEATTRRLEAALLMCVGMEAFLALRDVGDLDADEADEVASWAANAMLEAALRDSGRRPSKRKSAKASGK